MPFELKDTFVVGISATALFDMSESDALFRSLQDEDPDGAIEAYSRHMEERENLPLEPGTGFPLVEALLKLNQLRRAGDQSPLVEVVVMSRNSPSTGLRVLHTIRHYGLPISRSAFTAGESVVDYLEAFDVDLFLTTNPVDAQKVIDSRACAAATLRDVPPSRSDIPEGQVRIAFDGDAVLFSEESELVYKAEGLEAFHAAEDENQDQPLQDGPYANMLRKLSKLQERLPGRIEHSRIRIALVTARNSPAEMRVIKTLRSWGVHIDEAFFLGGVEKSRVLKAFKPHIFFDDQDVHLESASALVPSGKVPYQTDSELNKSKSPAAKPAARQD
jgi:5'-nucleotidase